jgi:hypothetical protein
MQLQVDVVVRAGSKIHGDELISQQGNRGA